jgi:hypothetical protein
VLPRFLVIPDLNAFHHAAFAGEANNVVSSVWPNAALNGKDFGRAISEVDDDTVKENGIAADPQLNGVKEAIASGDLDFVMIPSAVNLRNAQEIPYLSLGRQRNSAGNNEKTRQ